MRRRVPNVWAPTCLRMATRLRAGPRHPAEEAQTESDPRLSRSAHVFRPPHVLCSRYGEDFVTVATAMRFHVTREGAVMENLKSRFFATRSFPAKSGRTISIGSPASLIGDLLVSSGWREKPNRSCWTPARPCHRQSERRVSGRRRRLP